MRKVWKNVHKQTNSAVSVESSLPLLSTALQATVVQPLCPVSGGRGQSSPSWSHGFELCISDGEKNLRGHRRTLWPPACGNVQVRRWILDPKHGQVTTVTSVVQVYVPHLWLLQHFCAREAWICGEQVCRAHTWEVVTGQGNAHSSPYGNSLQK